MKRKSTVRQDFLITVAVKLGGRTDIVTDQQVSELVEGVAQQYKVWRPAVWNWYTGCTDRALTRFINEAVKIANTLRPALKD